MRRTVFWPSALVLIASASGACKEEGTVTVTSHHLRGRQGGGRGRGCEACWPRGRARSCLGPEDYFDRARFDADLKRIQAFYADRGYPDARVTGFDVKLNDKQDAVSS